MCWGHWWPCPRPLGLHRALQPGGGLSYSFLLPASWSKVCLVLSPMWLPVVTQSCAITKGLGWLPPWHHHQVSVLPSHGWDKLECGTRSSRPARCHALTLSPNRGMATSVDSTTPRGCWPILGCTCSLFLPEAHLHQCPPIVALLTALTYL